MGKVTETSLPGGRRVTKNDLTGNSWIHGFDTSLRHTSQRRVKDAQASRLLFRDLSHISTLYDQEAVTPCLSALTD